MPINQVIQILQANCETVKAVQLIYNDKVLFVFCRDFHLILKLIVLGSIIM